MNFDIKDFKNPNLKDLDEYRHMYEKSVTDPSSFFLEHALKELDWFEKPNVGYSGKITKPTWFRDGVLNISHNCIDRHAAKNPNKTAIIWQGDEKENTKNIFKGKSPPVLYGGSVDGNNVEIFREIREIDGFLIGGASKSSKKFIDIIKNYYR